MKKVLILVLTVTLFSSCIDSIQVQAATKNNWQKLYLDYVNKNYKKMDLYEAALIYIDNDNVPELYIKSKDDTFLANDNCMLLAIAKNKVKKNNLTNNKFTYTKKKNHIYCHSDQGIGVVDYSQMYRLQNGKTKLLWKSMCDLDITQRNSDVLYYYVNDKVVSEKKYKSFISKETSKHKWKNVDKELKPLKSIVKSQLKKSVEKNVLKNLTCFSTYNTTGMQIEGTQITKVKLSNTTLTIWGSFTGRNSKENEKVYPAKKRSFKLTSNVKFCTAGEEGETFGKQNVLDMLNVSELCCGFAFELDKSGKITKIETYL